MSHNVFANGMEVSCKASSGKTICNFPDVCLTPPTPPAGPLPIPYPNTGMASDTSEGSTSVKIAGQEVMLKNKSCFSKSTGDEAATKSQGMGVVTHEITGKVYFTAWSMNVKVEGENVPRHLDLTTNNHMSKMPGNTPPMPHISSMAMGQVGSSPPCKAAPGAGNPVNPIVGCKFLSGEDDRDFLLEGPLDLTWQRQYFSDNEHIGWLGQGWSLPFEVWVEVGPSELTLVDSEGRHIRCARPRRDAAVFLPTERSWIRQLESGHIAWDMPEGIRMTFQIPTGVPGDERLALISIVDRNGNEHRIERLDDRTWEIRASGGQLLRLRFAASGRLLSVEHVQARMPTSGGLIDGGGLAVTLVTYEYNQDGDLVAVRDRTGAVRRRFAWKNHIMVAHTDAAGLVSTYEWDELSPRGRVTQFGTSDGRSLRFSYVDDGTIVTDELGRTRRFLKDVNGRWVGVIDALGGEHRRVLDRYGNVVALVAPSGAAYVSRLNERGLPEETMTPTGAQTLVEWHPVFDLPTKVTDPLGRAAAYTYDDRGNLVAQVARDGSRIEYVVDQRGLVVKVVYPAEQVEEIDYNDIGQPTRFLDSSGKETRLTYDENGWLTSISDPLSQVTQFLYDAAGNCTSEVQEDGGQKEYLFDAAGRIVAGVDPDGSRTSYVLRPDGQPVSRTDGEGHTLAYGYDRAGRLIELVNENGRSYRFEYDALDRPIRQVNVDLTSISYAYGDTGFLRESIEQGTDSSQIRTTMEHDEVGQLVAVRSGSEETTFAYDAAGNLVTAANLHARVELAYDELDRITSEAVAHATGDSVVSYSYDQQGNCIGMRLSDGRLLSYSMYGTGHVREISLDGRPILQCERDDLHREVLRHQGLLRTRFRYDPVGRLVEQVTDLDVGAVGEPARPTRLPWQRAYGYTRNGNILNARSGESARAFAYDRVDRLTRHANRDVDERFHFDPATNLVDAPGSAVLDDRVKRHVMLDYAFDGFGRVVTKNGGRLGNLTLHWNERHELTVLERQTRERRTVVQYEYDPFGRRIAKRDAEGVTRFVWDGDQLLEEQRRDRLVSYVYSPGTYAPVASLARRVGRASTAPPTDGAADVVVRYYHTDHLGTPERLSNEQGDWIWSAQYAAFGTVLPTVEEVGREADASQPLRFQGQYYDDESGLHYNRHRYYDPDVGRFLSPDPIGLEGGTNLYVYAPNPTGWVDPEGLLSYPLAPMTGFQQHHIVPQQLKNHPALKKAGFDIHDEKNIIYLPKCEAAHPTKTIHRGSHPKYTQNVLQRLNRIEALGKQRGWSQARYQKAIKDEVAKLRRGLNRGTTKLNRNSTRTGKCKTCGC